MASITLLASGLLNPQLSMGEEGVTCPKSIAFIARESLSEEIRGKYRQIYIALGCQTEFMRLPGRRGVRAFNEKRVDGEFFRLKRAEAFYERRFVRSSVPLFSLISGVWVNPDLEGTSLFPIGYVLGVVWQEEYMKGRHGLAFHTTEKMYEAYSNGRLSGFLEDEYVTGKNIASGKLLPAPKLKAVVVAEPLYHYLGIEFTPFMMKFSEYIRQNNSFSFISSKDSAD